MSEREQFIKKMEHEFQTTLKVLKAYPADQKDLKPHAKCPTALELAWRIVSEVKLFVDGAITGTFDFMTPRPAPVTMQAAIAAYESDQRESVEKLKKMSDANFEKKVPFMVAPKTMGEVRSGDTLWMMLNDSIHHRGQFSVYLRMADGKVPSIYGPSADEPWM